MTFLSKGVSILSPFRYSCVPALLCVKNKMSQLAAWDERDVVHVLFLKVKNRYWKKVYVRGKNETRCSIFLFVYSCQCKALHILTVNTNVAILKSSGPKKSIQLPSSCHHSGKTFPSPPAASFEKSSSQMSFVAGLESHQFTHEWIKGLAFSSGWRRTRKWEEEGKGPFWQNIPYKTCLNNAFISVCGAISL